MEAAVRRTPQPRRDWFAAAVLAGLTVVVFYPATGYSFVNYDDPRYVYDNAHVTAGLTWQDTQWAFTTLELGNWHPLNWLSLQLDATFWKTDPFGFHLTNVLLHAASVAVLFLALRSLTGAFWRSLAVALLFAVHPLRVEPVAWVAERKGVLSVFFGLLALWAYAGYARRPSWWLYAAVLLAFCASLMSKPALVTLPFLLLVLDWWPLERLQMPALWRRVAEKLPLLVPAIGITVAGYIAQARAGAVLSLPLSERAANAVTRCVVYLRQTVWPAGLAAHYPLATYPGGAPARVFVLAGLGLLVLLGLTAGAFVVRRRAPYLLVGWLWFLGTLAPVVVVQISRFAHADRYTYFPQIGLLIAVCWGAAALAGRHAREVLTAGAVAVVVLAALTRAQLPVWHDSLALWEYTRRTTGDSSMTLMKLGEVLEERNRLEEAAGCYSGAVRADPDLAVTHSSYARLLQRQNRLPEAESELRKACQLDPANALTHAALGVIFRAEGRQDEAAGEFDEAVRLMPRLFLARCDLGQIEMKRGNFARAAEQYGAALELEPNSAEAHAGLADALLKLGRTGEALDHFRASVSLEPRSARWHYGFGTALEASGDLERAARSYTQAIQLNPKMAAAWYSLGMAWFRQEKWSDAAIALAGAVELDPDSPLLVAAFDIAVKRLADSGQPGQAQRIREQLHQRLLRSRSAPR